MIKFSKPPSNYSFWLLNAAAYLTWLGVLAIALPHIIGSPQRTLLFILFGLFFIGLTVYVFLEERPFLVHLYLLFQLIITWIISSLIPIAAKGSTSTFFFILSAQSMLFLPLIPGLLWIVAFIIVTWFGGVLTFGFITPVGIISTTGGYLFFGTFGAALRQANAARQHTQRLLADLQQAHDQLQAYTSQAQQLAVAEERNRLAREMHDALGHRLTVAVVQLEGAQRLIPTQPDRSATMIEAMRTQLKQALAELRQTVSALRSPNGLPELSDSLETAVSNLVHTFQEATGLSIHLDLPSALPPLPQSHQLALYRAAQESLTNVQRHANAQQAWLTLTTDAEQITLTVSDDGQGFNDEGDGRFGLVGLRERAKQLGGSLQLSSAAQGGAMLRLQLPISSSEVADV
ncbi:hypothetical protein MNBD_CHLOROFLEXI01-2474 [hydrothermal vent metagenome]|uniref:histidine kinase n=1 Tax=hydrothermal vent metagenome TaxID=652676 RepID=A0A3B0W5I6_9ZZZZ